MSSMGLHDKVLRKFEYFCLGYVNFTHYSILCVCCIFIYCDFVITSKTLQQLFVPLFIYLQLIAHLFRASMEVQCWEIAYSAFPAISISDVMSFWALQPNCTQHIIVLSLSVSLSPSQTNWIAHGFPPSPSFPVDQLLNKSQM